MTNPSLRASLGPRDRPVADGETQRQIIEDILRAQIDLAKPDDLAWLESQVRWIAGQIVARLCSPRDQ
jgi:hypothetical protein